MLPILQFVGGACKLLEPVEWAVYNVLLRATLGLSFAEWTMDAIGFNLKWKENYLLEKESLWIMSHRRAHPNYGFFLDTASTYEYIKARHYSGRRDGGIISLALFNVYRNSCQATLELERGVSLRKIGAYKALKFYFLEEFVGIDETSHAKPVQ